MHLTQCRSVLEQMIVAMPLFPKLQSFECGGRPVFKITVRRLWVEVLARLTSGVNLWEPWRGVPRRPFQN
jgi:hypothetical protein